MDSSGAQPETFWTACGTCRLLHEFDRTYLGKRLRCPVCLNSFPAVEVNPDAQSNEPVNGKRNTGSRVSADGLKRKKDPTLLEIQKKAVRSKSKKNGKSDEMDAEEDPECCSFGGEGVEKRFACGQVWAILDDEDGVPRHYGLLTEVLSVVPFEVRMRWLDLQRNWDGSVGLPIFSRLIGVFKAGMVADMDSVNLFSHVVNCEMVGEELYKIVPNKGSVWAVYGEETIGGGEERCYEVVVLLTSYGNGNGMSVGLLEKVDVCKMIFAPRRENGVDVVKWVEKDGFRFSHQIPARKVLWTEGLDLPKECWELDPASVPSKLL